jgi:predicted Rossmann fold nucleotide-binding protein DprA/Smf involved in DNA uptake
MSNTYNVQISLDTELSMIGSAEIMNGLKLAFFSSVKCPGTPIIRALNTARDLRILGIIVASGFQSPIEKDCLDILLKGTQPVIICPARSIKNMRLPAKWKTAIRENRLLLISPFDDDIKRPRKIHSEERNEFVVKLADMVLIAYAHPGGKIEALAKKAIEWGKPVFTFDTLDNKDLLDLGAQVFDLTQIEQDFKKV